MKILKSQKNKFDPKNKKAFTVLFAVIVSSLILALGLGIVAITMKEVKLSGTGRDSQLAFYAADSGSECAMYNDLVKTYFATSSSSAKDPTIKCNNVDITATTTSSTEASASSTFRMYMEYNGTSPVKNKPCVDVSVSKYIVNNTEKTTIDARGYNTCDEDNTRRLERGYRVEY